MTPDERFDRLEQLLQGLEQFLLDFRQETASRFQVIENRLDILSATVANLESRFPPLTKAILDFGSLATKLSNEQSRQKAASVDLSARVDKLEAIVSRLQPPAA